ncbi:MAG: hypothetical protein RPR40_02750 [Bermanella sp.]
MAKTSGFPPWSQLMLGVLLLSVVIVAIWQSVPVHAEGLLIPDVQVVESLTGPMAKTVEALPAQLVGSVPVLLDGALASGLLPDWLAVLLATLYGLSHAATILPISVLNRWPGPLRSLLGFAFANYGGAKNRDEVGWVSGLYK